MTDVDMTEKSTTTTTTTTSSSNGDNTNNNTESMMDDTSNTKNNNYTSMMTDDDDDYVVTEMPVYLSQNLADNLFLFQYPLRQPWRPYDMSKLQELRVKPKQQRVEMDLAIETESENYNDQSEIKPDSYTLSSTTVSHRTNYAVGIVRNDELHLTPLQSIIQLRPHFKTVDDLYQEEKAEKKRTAMESGEVDEDEENKQQPISYRKPTAKQAAALPGTMLKKMEDEEQWIKLDLVDDSSNESTIQNVSKLMAPETKEIPFDLDRFQYLDLLCPRIPEEWVPKASHLQETVSLEAIHQMPWANQVKQILINGSIQPFSKIYQLLGDNTVSEFDVVQELDNIAVLLKGRWVIKSDVIHKESNMIIARNYLIHLFFEQEFVNRKEFAERTHLSPEESREMISKIANINHTVRQWYLKQQPDEDFLHRFPLIADKHEYNLRDQKEQTLAALDDIMDPSKNPLLDIMTRGIMDAGHGSKLINVKASQMAMDNGGVEATSLSSIPEDFTVGKTLDQQLLFFLYNLLKQHGVCNIQFIKQRLALKGGEEIPNNLLKDFENDKAINDSLNLIADKAHHAYFLKSSGNANIDKYRRVVIDLFKKKMILKRTDITDSCQQVLGEDIPASFRTTILSELAYLSKNSAWVFKAGN
ncbi:hypothetical protein SAMD00019534_117960 [Acytostelium subglobosum LB1]|uniref:hypothetical protein n=1 Tax=Acytostelium subglobosum LB1 TaxID=1410327 RepID=UPI000644B524|nr:hypothetical protein SAMD00019534_117960 [Acytostelium subglobosum LB1]GAM28620.1 hypothetical protein SAMD00019534_117960 [Acytostelium subglobosum LB1]|eukprot:XP_012748398.1 hypothetical protein SAMD00019534_117960 [Acytostelium subglobosum LB1]